MEAIDNIGASLYLSAPVCSFRKGYAREYLETEEIPPPSTIYGFLLSLVGEEDRYKYLETEIAYALLSKPELSVVLRTVWRIKDNKKLKPGIGQNRRPDYQEILTGLEMVIFIREGELATRIADTGNNPHQTLRFGGLSLGESHDLINDVIWNPDLSGMKGRWLTGDHEGEYTLPVWVDHVGSKNTVWRQFSLLDETIQESGVAPRRWIKITNQDTVQTSA